MLAGNTHNLAAMLTGTAPAGAAHPAAGGTTTAKNANSALATADHPGRNQKKAAGAAADAAQPSAVDAGVENTLSAHSLCSSVPQHQTAFAAVLDRASRPRAAATAVAPATVSADGRAAGRAAAATGSAVAGGVAAARLAAQRGRANAESAETQAAEIGPAGGKGARFAAATADKTAGLGAAASASAAPGREAARQAPALASLPRHTAELPGRLAPSPARGSAAAVPQGAGRDGIPAFPFAAATAAGFYAGLRSGEQPAVGRACHGVALASRLNRPDAEPARVLASVSRTPLGIAGGERGAASAVSSGARPSAAERKPAPAAAGPRDSNVARTGQPKSAAGARLVSYVPAAAPAGLPFAQAVSGAVEVRAAAGNTGAASGLGPAGGAGGRSAARAGSPGGRTPRADGADGSRSFRGHVARPARQAVDEAAADWPRPGKPTVPHHASARAFALEAPPGAARAASEAGTGGDAARQAEAAPVADQVAAAIRASGLRSQPQVVVRLSPPELGKVRVTLRASGAGVRAVMEADNPETVRRLEQEGAALASRLEDAGVPLRRLDVVLARQDARPDGEGTAGQPDRRSDGRPGGAPGSGHVARSARPAVDEAAADWPRPGEPAVPHPASAAGGSVRINVWI
ncbi:MAG: hypothetical protein FJ288_05380 [Planctomycetes bacterium]|nr:hypothetical protein [Planctomycetota bacterium]